MILGREKKGGTRTEVLDIKKVIECKPQRQIHPWVLGAKIVEKAGLEALKPNRNYHAKN